MSAGMLGTEERGETGRRTGMEGRRKRGMEKRNSARQERDLKKRNPVLTSLKLSKIGGEVAILT